MMWLLTSLAPRRHAASIAQTRALTPLPAPKPQLPSLEMDCVCVLFVSIRIRQTLVRAVTGMLHPPGSF